MSQFDFGTIDPVTKNGTELAADLNQFRDSVYSTNKGPSRPSYADAGTMWIDDSGDPVWLVNLFNGLAGPDDLDMELFSVNKTTGLVSLGGAVAITPANIGTAGAATNDVLVFNGATAAWEPLSDIPVDLATGVTGILPDANVANALTIDGGTVNNTIIGGTGAAAASFTTISASAAFTLTQSIGATSTDGILLQNTTAATVGAQKWSPRIHWLGKGWKTDATAASQVVDWIAELVPVQGAANPSSLLQFSSQVNAGGYTVQFSLDSATGAVATGLWHGTPVSELYGGTNQSSFAAGDILYCSATNVLSKLSIGASNTILTVSSGVPAWGTIVSSLWQNGSAGVPSYSFTNDTDTGAYLDSDGVYAISTAGVNRVKISSTGLNLTGGLIVSGALTFTTPLDVSGANVTGVLAAARFPALSGDISNTAGSLTTAIGANKVTLGMMAQMSTASLLGRNTAAIGNVEELSAATAKSLLSLNLVENTALSTWAGSSNITTLGTLAGNLVIDGTANRASSMARNTTAATGGKNLTVGAGGATSGTTDLSGGTLVLVGGVSTGLATAPTGMVTMQKYVPATATGTADNSSVNCASFGRTIPLTSGTIKTLFTMGSAAGSGAGCTFSYFVEATDGTDFITEIGHVVVSTINKAGVWTQKITVKYSDQNLTGIAVLVVTFAQVGANPSSVRVTATVTGITATSIRIGYTIINDGAYAMTTA